MKEPIRAYCIQQDGFYGMQSKSSFDKVIVITSDGTHIFNHDANLLWNYFRNKISKSGKNYLNEIFFIGDNKNNLKPINIYFGNKVKTVDFDYADPQIVANINNAINILHTKITTNTNLKINL